jgi:tetratricopeptide (TPR) repeat protein
VSRTVPGGKRTSGPPAAAARRWSVRRIGILAGGLLAAGAALLLTKGWWERLLRESAHYQAVVQETEALQARRREQAGAIRALEARLRADPADSETRLRLAGLRWRREGPAAAAATLAEAPRPIADLDVARMLAHCARLARREDLALHALDEAIARYPQEGSLRADRGLLYVLLAWHRDAERELRAAEQAGADTLLARATLARARGDAAGARSLLEKGLQEQPGDPELTRQLAAVAEDLRHYDEAIRLRQSLQQSDPGGTDRLDLAADYLRKGDLASLAQAMELLDRALAARPGDTRARFLHARCLRRLNRTAEAQRELAALHRAAPHLFGPAFELAELLRAQGRAPEAQALLAEHRVVQERRSAHRHAAETLVRAPDGAAAHCEAGRLCQESGLAGRAIVEFERALRIDPQLPGVKERLDQARAAAPRAQAEPE